MVVLLLLLPNLKIHLVVLDVLLVLRVSHLDELLEHVSLIFSEVLRHLGHLELSWLLGLGRDWGCWGGSCELLGQTLLFDQGEGRSGLYLWLGWSALI